MSSRTHFLFTISIVVRKILVSPSSYSSYIPSPRTRLPLLFIFIFSTTLSFLLPSPPYLSLSLFFTPLPWSHSLTSLTSPFQDVPLSLFLYNTTALPNLSFPLSLLTLSTFLLFHFFLFFLSSSFYLRHYPLLKTFSSLPLGIICLFPPTPFFSTPQSIILSVFPLLSQPLGVPCVAQLPFLFSSSSTISLSPPSHYPHFFPSSFTSYSLPVSLRHPHVCNEITGCILFFSPDDIQAN